jgi:glycosyltransferase involved in cell wall biosynthesis
MLASGLPLVASSVHGILDYAKDAKTGFLADPYSVNEFANGIEKLTNKKLRQNLIPDCIEMARKFDCTVSNKQMETIYEELIGY